jgi:hypothetical protein
MKMKKFLLTAALALVPALFFTGKVMAQTKQYGTEVCVNASLVDQAKRLFPNATIHVLPDFADREMNGWRIVSGPVGPKGRIHTDAEEMQLRRHERSHDSSVRGE